MVKSKQDTVATFNEQVNMSVEELQSWLQTEQSHTAGTGVGHHSGEKIVDILKKNPQRDPEKYEEDDLDHMRKVVGYNSRHLAQEEHLKETKTREELANTKSTISLKNWGHDPIKTLEERSPREAKAAEDRDPTVAEQNMKRKRNHDEAEGAGSETDETDKKRRAVDDETEDREDTPRRGKQQETAKETTPRGPNEEVPTTVRRSPRKHITASLRIRKASTSDGDE